MTRTQNILLVFAFITLAILYFFRIYGLNLNAAMYLQGAQMLLQGQKPYIDFIDINPPLIFYFSSLAALISQLFSYPGQVIVIYKILLLMYIGCSLWAVTLCIRPITSLFRTSLFSLLFGFTIYCIYLIQNRVFGEREHLFIIALFPYLILRWLVYSEHLKPPSVIALLIGVTLGLTACLKPHFLAAVIVYEMALLYSFKTSRLTKEVWPVILAPLLYLLHFLFLPQSIYNAFWLESVPMVRQYYGSFEKDFPRLVTNDTFALVSCLSICIASLFLKGPTLTIRFLRIFSLLGLVFLISYFQQAKGWNYHLIPIYFYLFIFVSVFIWAYPLLTKNRIFWFVAVVAFALVLKSTYNTYNSIRALMDPTKASTYWPALPKLYPIVRENSKSSEPILIISPTNIYNYPLMLQMNRTPGSRYLFHYPLSFFAPIPTHPLSVEYLRRLKEDIQQRNPTLIVFVTEIVETHLLPPNFDIYNYYVNGGIVDHEFQEKYERLPTDSGIIAFKLRH